MSIKKAKCLTFHRSKLVLIVLLVCQSCSLEPATGYCSTTACSINHEVHFLRCSSYRDQQHQQHNCIKNKGFFFKKKKITLSYNKKIIDWINQGLYFIYHLNNDMLQLKCLVQKILYYSTKCHLLNFTVLSIINQFIVINAEHVFAELG